MIYAMLAFYWVGTVGVVWLTHWWGEPWSFVPITA